MTTNGSRAEARRMMSKMGELASVPLTLPFFIAQRYPLTFSFFFSHHFRSALITLQQKLHLSRAARLFAATFICLPFLRVLSGGLSCCPPGITPLFEADYGEKHKAKTRSSTFHVRVILSPFSTTTPAYSRNKGAPTVL